MYWARCPPPPMVWFPPWTSHLMLFATFLGGTTFDFKNKYVICIWEPEPHHWPCVPMYSNISSAYYTQPVYQLHIVYYIHIASYSLHACMYIFDTYTLLKAYLCVPMGTHKYIYIFTYIYIYIYIYIFTYIYIYTYIYATYVLHTYRLPLHSLHTAYQLLISAQSLSLPQSANSTPIVPYILLVAYPYTICIYIYIYLYLNL